MKIKKFRIDRRRYGLKIPDKAFAVDTAAYIAEFERLNYLKPIVKETKDGRPVDKGN